MYDCLQCEISSLMKALGWVTPILDGGDLMGLHNLPCSSVTNSRCLLLLMLSQLALFSAKSHEGWMNQKVVWQGQHWMNLRVSFSLERRVCARYKAMWCLWGRGNPVLQWTEVFCTSSYDAGCVIWDCSVTNPGAIQDFMFLQELLVGAEPPTLMFTVEICLRERLLLFPVTSATSNTSSPTELPPRVGHGVPTKHWHCARCPQGRGTCLQAWHIWRTQSHCLIIWFHKQSRSLCRRNYPVFHQLILDLPTVKRSKQWRAS